MAEAPDNIAPIVLIEVEGVEVGEIYPFLQQVEYESADGMTDMVKIQLSNPDFIISKSKIFQPYNEIRVYFGYGNADYIGSAIITRPRISFPPDGMPIVTIKGYTKDWLMMKSDPADKKRREQQSEAASKAGNKKLAKAIKRINYKDMPINEVVEQIALENFLRGDIDPVDIKEIGNLDRPADVTDYDFVKALSNLTGFYFWVDADFKGNWYLHFRDPNKPLDIQDKQYTFKYNQGELSTLLTFEPEITFSDKYTEVKAQAFANKFTYEGGQWGTIMEQEFVIDDAKSTPDMIYDGDAEGELKSTFEDAEAVQVYVGDFSFKVLPVAHINSPDKLKAFVTSWFQANRNNFIKGQGQVTGLETLMARQIHTLDGLGHPFDGDYYFSKVRHIFANNGYICDFTARKVVK